MRSRNVLRLLLAIAVVMVIGLPRLFAQSAGTGALTGTLTDPSGASIPNATVTLTNTQTNQARTSTTGADGTYRFPLIPPGMYRVRFSAMGFKTAEVSSFTVNVTETPVLDRTMEVGAQTEQVTVEANQEILQTSESTLGRVVDGATISNQPLATRNYTSIMGLEAGAAGGVGNATTLGKGTLDIAVNGAGLDQNNIMMDGATIVNAFGAGNNADSGIYVGVAIANPDAIQEFKVQTSTYDASYGRNPGANVNIITKSGSNQLHGSLFEFLRNEALNANSFFYNRDNPASTRGVKQVLKQNQFGGTVGGPIIKDKLFFFGSYQGTRQRNGVSGGGSASPILPPIPAGDRSAPGFRAALGAAMCPANHPGNAAYLTGFGNPAQLQMACDGSNISNVALNMLNVKLPNGAYYIPGSTNGGFQQANFSIPSIYTGDQYLANADWVVNSRNTLAMRYFFTEDPQTTPFSISNIQGTPSSSYYANTISRVKLTTVVSPSFINEAQASLERNIANGSDSAPYTNQQVGITGIVPQETLPPVMVIVGAMTLGGTLAPFYGPANQMQYADHISWSHGKHTIRAGFEYEFLQWNLSFASLLRGFLFSPGFNDFLIGRPGGDPAAGGTGGLGTFFQCLFCVRSGPNGIIHGYRERNADWYVQDDWKVSSHLTVNVGLRWEYDGVFGDHYGNLTNVWPSLLQTVPTPPTGPQATGAGLVGYVVPSNFTNHYPSPPAGVTTLNTEFPSKNGVPKDDFGPRIGFAWNPTDRLVMRGGFGMFYDRVGSSKFVHAVEQGVPYALTLDYGGGASIPYSLANPFPSTPLGFVPRWFNPATGANSALNTPFYESVHAPLSRQFNLGLQYELGKRWLLEAGYVGSSGINQANYNHNINLAQLASPSNPINGQTTNTLANAAYRVPYLGYQAIGLQATAYDAIYNYNSLQVTVRKQLSHGLSMQGAYTWSKDLTNLSNGNLPGEGQTNVNDANRTGTQYGPAAFSHPHRFVLSYAYDLPFGNPQGVWNKLVTGWNISGNTIAQTGTPLTFTDTAGGTAYYGAANPGSAEGGSSTVQLCPGVTYGAIPSSGGVESRLGGASGGPGFMNKSAFCAPIAIGPDGATTFGNAGLGIVRGPDQVNFDASVIKNTRLSERQNLQFRAEFFNIANHPVFGNPTVARNNANLFGVINTTVGNPRLIQFALKYSF